MIKYILRNLVNDAPFNSEVFDTMVDALNYRMAYIDRDVVWVDEVLV